MNVSKIVLLALCLSSPTLAAQPPVPRLVGTWRVVEFCDVDTPGDTTYPLGRRPIGLFIYDPAGNLSIQAMRAAPSGAFLRDSIPLGGMAELRSSYFGYFGTYTITSDSTVVHRVTGGTIPSYIGTDQPRNYRIRGDTLSIGGDEPWSCRRLVRVRS
jgi:Lipocalin-like domain